MCGITGYIDFNYSTKKGVLQKMSRTLAHRGPDGEGHAVYETDEALVGFGHRRLRILDLSDRGKQPMQYAQYTITYNGEVYNFKEIKKELTGLGHKFQSDSDTEVILHAFAEWGKESIHRFIGMFALALFDASARKVTLIRDRAGVKPLFYYYHNGLFLFASELKAFHPHPAFQKALNHQAVAAYMQYGYVPAHHCIFEHAHKLPAAHLLELDLRDRKHEIFRYWDVKNYYNKPKLDIDFQTAKTETEKCLSTAFQYRMVADVPVGVFLSGGYDSTLATALLQKNSNKKIRTFTIGVGDERLNEAPYARQTARHLGTDHHEYYCTQADALHTLHELPYYYDEPFADDSAIPTMLVSRMAQSDVKVALSADGGDEAFAGYNRYDYLQQIQKLKKTPAALRNALAAVMGILSPEQIPFLRRHPLFSQRYEKIRRILKDTSSGNLLKNLSTPFFEDDWSKFFTFPVEKLPAFFDHKLDNGADDFSQMLATDYETYLTDDILQKVDRATMSTGLEGREPYLDQHIIEFVARLPNTYKYHQGVKKHLLREITHQYVPKTLMDRPKMGFAIPLSKWMHTTLKPVLDKYLDSGFIQKQGLFNWEETEKYKRAFYNGKKQHLMKLWFLLMFQMWYEQWM